MSVRPTPEQVLLLAPDRAAAAAATGAADPGAWSAAGCDEQAVWGQYIATSAEPYEVAVDLGGPAFRCSCPSRKVPCKHCLGLLLMHAQQHVAPAKRLPFAQQWMQRRDRHPTAHQADTVVDVQGSGDDEVAVDAAAAGAQTRARTGADDRRHEQREQRQLDRAERMRAGLHELDRWLADTVRTGLTAPALADADTWDRLAARLVDAQCGGLANRVKRVATRVGQHARWYEDVLEEMAVLHALAQGALRTSTLPIDLADGVHAASGLTVNKDDVLAGVPSTARWSVLGESRVREDKITVQRTWLATQGLDAAGAVLTTWAMVLAFGAFGNEVTTEHQVATEFEADVHWYPGAAPLRALVGRRYDEPRRALGAPVPVTVAEAVGAAGWAMAREPWLERHPLLVQAVPLAVGNGRWTLADATGAIPIVPGFWRLAEIVAISGGRPIVVMGELSADGVLPLTLWSEAGVVLL